MYQPKPFLKELARKDAGGGRIEILGYAGHPPKVRRGPNFTKSKKRKK